ncbi:MAG: hypothetical protein MK213_06195, partial [Planctomycetes bacterium]|nr:hypothetical protein [Planctomycetota bacterium]
MRDGVLFLEAASFALLEGEEHRVPGTWMRPWLEGNLVDAVSRRVQALGADRELLGDAAPWKERFPQLLTALEGRTVIIAQDRESFLLRFKTHLPDGELPTVLTLEELGVFLHPKRGDRSFAGLWREHCSNTPPLAPRATDLRRLCEALISKHFERDLNLRKLVARGFDNIEDASSDDPGPAASWLRTCRALLNRTSEWGFAAPGEERLFGTTLEDGMFEYDLDNAPLDADRCLDAIVPAFRAEYDTFFAETDALQIRQEDKQAPLEPEDLEILERFFDRLPLEFASEGETPPERPGQRALAHAVRGCLENHQFLLADAPTGTGKTLAYLGPLLLWAVRHQTRTGVSTYTRALQEQAFFREIPRALKLLQEAGLPFENLPRVSMLKGRNNFICGRAIRDTAPTTGSSSAVAHASWLRLALYYCEDPAADLDGFPADPGIPLGNSMSTMREARAAINSVRAIPQCCVGRALKRCPAGIRTLRADRSHVIITNHAFVLARPDYFQHLVFDECDHLHQVTTSALSFDIEFDEVYNLCKNLQHGRGRDASPMQQLVRILTRLAPGDVSDELRLAAKNASEGVSELDTASLACLRELKAYRAWRRDNGDHLSREEKAFLLHDFLQLGLGDALATALNSLKEAVDKLDSGLRTVIEELGTVPLRAAGRLRWSLRKPLDLLAHWREGLFLW